METMKFGLKGNIKNAYKCPYCKSFGTFRIWGGRVGKKQCFWCHKFFKLPLKKEQLNLV